MVVLRQKLDRGQRHSVQDEACGGRTSSDIHRGHTCKAASQCGSAGVLRDSKTVTGVSTAGLGEKERAAMGLHSAYIRESLAASDVLALVRLLASVRPDVDCQCTPLDEALTTPRRAAGVWPLVGVYPVVPLQVRLSVEALRYLVSEFWSAEFAWRSAGWPQAAPKESRARGDDKVRQMENQPCCMTASHTGRGEQSAHSRQVP
jgi:hypothetical protein